MFRVVRFIAAGHVALKTIRPEVLGDSRMLVRFKREIEYATGGSLHAHLIDALLL